MAEKNIVWITPSARFGGARAPIPPWLSEWTELDHRRVLAQRHDLASSDRILVSRRILPDNGPLPGFTPREK